MSTTRRQRVSVRVRRALRRLAVVAVAAGVATSASVTTAQAARVPDGFYTTPFGPEVFRVGAPTDENPDGLFDVSFAEWVAAGSPAPRQMPVRYVKVPWSPTVTAQVRVDPSSVDPTFLYGIDFATWTRVGRPAPTTVYTLDSGLVVKYGTGGDIFVIDPYENGDHRLSYAEWQASGFMPYEDLAGEGFIKLSWDSTIGYTADLEAPTVTALLVDFGYWAARGFPTPLAQDRFPGDELTQVEGDPTITYSGPTVSRAISFDEWARLGFPAPTVLPAAG